MKAKQNVKKKKNGQGERWKSTHTSFLLDGIARKK